MLLVHRQHLLKGFLLEERLVDFREVAQLLVGVFLEFPVRHEFLVLHVVHLGDDLVHFLVLAPDLAQSRGCLVEQNVEGLHPVAVVVVLLDGGLLGERGQHW